MPRRIRKTQLPLNLGLVQNLKYRSQTGNIRDFTEAWSSFANRGSIEAFPKILKTEDSATGSVEYMFSATNEAGTRLNIVYVDTGTACRVYAMSDAGVEGALLKSGLTTGTILDCTVAEDPDGVEYIFCCNGADTPFKIKISDNSVTDIGLAAPPGTSGLSVAKVGDGKVTGIVQYWISQVTGTTEGALSASFGKTNTRSQPDTLRISFNTTTDPALASKTFSIYRSYSNGEDPFFVGEVAVGASGTTTFDDNVPDAELGDPPFVHGNPPPQTTKNFITYFDRVYALDGNKVYWSDLGQPESFFTPTIGNHLTVGSGDGDISTALVRSGDSIIVFKRNHAYQILGRVPEEFNVKEIVPSESPSQAIGCPSHRAVSYTPLGIIFYWRTGVYTLEGSKIKKISKELTPFRVESEDIKRSVSIGYSPYLNRTFVSYRAAIPVPVGADVAGSMFVYDHEDKIWVGTAGWGANCFLVLGDEEDELFLLGGILGDNYPGFAFNTQDIVKLVPALPGFGEATPAPPAAGGVEFYPFFSNPLLNLQRYLWVDLYMQKSNGITGDITIRVDGEIIVPGIFNVSLTDSASGIDYQIVRVNIGSIGHDCSIAISDILNGSTPQFWRLHKVVLYYQDLALGSVTN